MIDMVLLIQARNDLGNAQVDRNDSQVQHLTLRLSNHCPLLTAKGSCSFSSTNGQHNLDIAMNSHELEK